METLKQDDKSISRITRDLKGKGHEYHRLVITGYLKAMTDLGVIKERAIPPSKVYSLPPHKRKNIYQLIGDLAKAMNLGYKKEGLLCVQVLETLFRRPVFQTELGMCGYEEPQGVKKVSKEERSEAKAILSASGLKVGPRENAYTSRKPFMGEVNDVMIELLVDISGTRSLRKETTQTTLEI